MSSTKDKPWVYIAGALTTGGQVIHNTRLAMQWWDKIYTTRLITPIVPHTSILQDLVFPINYETWMEYDFELLTRCDAIFRLNNKSNGADREVKFMLDNNKKVFYEKDYNKMLDWARNR